MANTSDALACNSVSLSLNLPFPRFEKKERKKEGEGRKRGKDGSKERKNRKDPSLKIAGKNQLSTITLLVHL